MRDRILEQLIESGELIHVKLHTKGRPAYGVAISVNAIKGTDWMCVTNNNPEAAHQRTTEPCETKRLRKRVIELESQLEAMMGYPYSDAPDTTGTEGLETMALLASGRERKQDPDSGKRQRGEVKRSRNMDGLSDCS